MFKKIYDFLAEGIWLLKLSEIAPNKVTWVRLCRVLLLTGRFFFQNKCILHAASLTYYTLLSIVPIFALMFGIAKGYGYDKVLRAK